MAVPLDVNLYSLSSTTVIVYPLALSSTVVVIPSNASVDLNLTVSPVVLLCLNSVTEIILLTPASPLLNGFYGNKLFAGPTEAKGPPPLIPVVPVPEAAVKV